MGLKGRKWVNDFFETHFLTLNINGPRFHSKFAISFGNVSVRNEWTYTKLLYRHTQLWKQIQVMRMIVYFITHLNVVHGRKALKKRNKIPCILFGHTLWVELHTVEVVI